MSPVLRGIIPPVVTPFTQEGEVDLSALRAVIEHLLAGGCHGIFQLGSTSEVAYLTDTQREEILATTLDVVDGRVPVLAGCIDFTAKRVAEQAQRAEKLGVDGVVATGPIYALNAGEEVADHFRLIASAVNVPVYAYDVPVRVHSKLSVDLLITLGKEGVIAGVKDSSGDDVSFRRLIRANRAHGSPLALYTGHETVCDSMVMAGADGIVPGLGNVDPAGYVRLWDAAVSDDWIQARVEQERLNDLFDIVFTSERRSGDASGVGAFKTAMVELGIMPSNTMAYPIKPLTDEARTKVQKIVRTWSAGEGQPV